MDYRKILLQKLVDLDDIDEDHFPIVTLDEYFIGNMQEDSIAPNQWGEGRPSIKELYSQFKKVEAREDVRGVFVGLHQSWGEALDDDSMWPPAENIHVFSSAPQEIAEQWIDGIHSDGIGTGWPYGKHEASPEPPDGFHVYTVYWD